MSHAQLTPEQPPDSHMTDRPQDPAEGSGIDGDSKLEQAEDLARLEQERADDEGMIVDDAALVQEPSREVPPDA